MQVNLFNHTYFKKTISNLQDKFNLIYQTTNLSLKIKKPKAVDVNFVSSREIKKLNSNYRNKNKVTDVISFAFDESIGSMQYLGEIYICVKQSKKQAKKYHHSFEREIAFLFVHGLLHLYGYDHIKEAEAKKMFKLQEKILNECKIYRKQ